MTSTEDNQTRRQQDQAVVDALMSDDAARAIEILYRTVVHGIPVPDPDVVATLAVQPPPPHPDRPRTHHPVLRRHTWIRTAVPLAIGLAAVIGSLGWSYADHNNRQQEWQRIAEEQTALADQRAEIIAEHDAWKKQVLAREAEYAAWKQKVLGQQETDQALRRRQAERIGAAKSAGDLTAALTVWANLADDIMSRNKDDGEAVRTLLDTLNEVLHSQKGPVHGNP